jgi:hypothetical protein
MRAILFVIGYIGLVSWFTIRARNRAERRHPTPRPIAELLRNGLPPGAKFHSVEYRHQESERGLRRKATAITQRWPFLTATGNVFVLILDKLFVGALVALVGWAVVIVGTDIVRNLDSVIADLNRVFIALGWCGVLGLALALLDWIFRRK